MLRRNHAVPILALLAVLAAGLLFLLPVGPLHAQNDDTITYNENDTSPVLTLSVTDPEGASPIVWSLLTAAQGAQDIPGVGTDGVGADDIQDDDIETNVGDLFEISAEGVLTFQEKPNYEMPRGQALSNTNTNEYNVVVQASDGTEMNWFKVTVNVQDLEEEGSVKLRPASGDTNDPQEGVTLLQPQVGVKIVADDLMDPDGESSNARGTSAIPAANATYQWYRTSSMTAPGTKIQVAGTDATEATYTPMATAGNSDVGSYLRVVATYTDGMNDGQKTAEAVSEYRTIDGNANNTDPAFPSDSAARAVPEGMDKGTAIGSPVTATDMDSDEKLTYWLSGTGDDSGEFDIDPGTGQLKVEDKLDFEMPEDVGVSGDDTNNEDDNRYVVEVTVADSSGTATDMITVTITVTNVDEKPSIDSGETVIEHREGGTVLDTDLSTGTVDAATYMASDQESGTITWSVLGDDGDKFKVTPTIGASTTLAFKDKPDFEDPGDMNDDNVYEVTVVASDGVNDRTREVTVKVTNIEELGEIEVMPAQPRVGIQLTADLTDKDGVVSGPTWQWYKQEVGATDTCADAAESWDEIKDAMSENYTPVSEDNEACLRVTATYVDGSYDDDGNTPDMRFDKSLTEDLAAKVQASPTNMPPEFDSATATRYVPENVPATTMVGLPVVAKDPGDTLGYTLGGTDAGSFVIGHATGQITVKANADLDHEDEDHEPTHTVTVTATDPHGASATITVTIHVTDVDEAPEIMQVPTENQAPMFPSSSTTRSIPEGQSLGRPIGVAVTATDPGDSLAYTLEGTDAASFSIVGNTGQLRTRVSLDYNTKSTYTVIVKATDRDGLSDTITVTITVTEVVGEQTGEVTLWDGTDPLTTPPQVGDTITGAVMDPDGGVNVTDWQWARTMTPDVMASWMDIQGETNADYMVAAGDTGYHLRVMATYTDAVGTDTAMEYSPATMMVGAEAVDTLFGRYDANDNNEIDLDEVFKAIDDYFDYDDRITLEEVYEIVDLYFES